MKLRHATITAITIVGVEYVAKRGVFDMPDDHAATAASLYPGFEDASKKVASKASDATNEQDGPQDTPQDDPQKAQDGPQGAQTDQSQANPQA